jgi:Polyketide cyclase / dehydrase and lipid transport
MSTVTLSAAGPLPATEAWERYALPRRWPEWSPQISRVEMPVERIAADVKGKLYAPGGFSLNFTIDAVDEAARTWAWTIRVAVIRLRLEHWVEEAPDGGSVAGLRTTGPAPVVAAYAPLAQTALDRLVRPLD